MKIFYLKTLSVIKKSILSGMLKIGNRLSRTKFLPGKEMFFKNFDFNNRYKMKTVIITKKYAVYSAKQYYL